MPPRSWSEVPGRATGYGFVWCRRHSSSCSARVRRPETTSTGRQQAVRRARAASIAGRSGAVAARRCVHPVGDDPGCLGPGRSVDLRAHDHLVASTSSSEAAAVGLGQLPAAGRRRRRRPGRRRPRPSGPAPARRPPDGHQGDQPSPRTPASPRPAAAWSPAGSGMPVPAPGRPSASRPFSVRRRPPTGRLRPPVGHGHLPAPRRARLTGPEGEVVRAGRATAEPIRWLGRPRRLSRRPRAPGRRRPPSRPRRGSSPARRSRPGPARRSAARAPG